MGLGGSKVRIVTQQDRAVLELKLQRDKLVQARKRMDEAIAREIDVARELARSGRRDRALLCLKRKRYQLNRVAEVEKMLDNINSLVNSIEFSKLQNSVFNSIREGKEALEDLNSFMSVDDIEKLLNQNAEAAALQQEITDMITGQITEDQSEEAEAELKQILLALADPMSLFGTFPSEPQINRSATMGPGKKGFTLKGRKKSEEVEEVETSASAGNLAAKPTDKYDKFRSQSTDALGRTRSISGTFRASSSPALDDDSATPTKSRSMTMSASDAKTMKSSSASAIGPAKSQSGTLRPIGMSATTQAQMARRNVTLSAKELDLDTGSKKKSKSKTLVAA